jgi:hypothetical protein
MSRRANALLFLLFVLVGCDNESPTAPTAIPPSAATPTPVPNLAGAWTGTVTFSHTDDDVVCPGRAVTASVRQVGDAVRLTGEAGCLQTLDFDGNLAGTKLAGHLSSSARVRDCAFAGSATGSGNPSRLELNGAVEACGVVVRIHIDLHR